jgi:hypothetical protein
MSGISEETVDREVMRRPTWPEESRKSRQRGPQASSPLYWSSIITIAHLLTGGLGTSHAI